MTSEIVAALDNLCVKTGNGRLIFDHVDFRLSKGKITCLTGPSGAGKTTFGLLLLGIVPLGMRIVGGKISILGRHLVPGDALQARAVRGRQVAMVFQDAHASLNPLRRCGVQVADVLAIHGMVEERSSKAAILDQFKAVGLDDAERIYQSFPHQISGGQRQRVLIAQATILKPAILIADEPTASLDSHNSAQVIELFGSLARTQQTAVLLITHDLNMVRAIGDRFLEMKEGRLQELQGTAVHGVEVRLPATRLVAAPALEVQLLSKSFPSRNGRQRSVILKELSLKVGAGEMVGILGPSGVGKTTLGRCIAGLEQPDTGAVLLAGNPVVARGLRPHDGRIQMVYQSPGSSLNPRMRILNIVGEALTAAGTPSSDHAGEIALLLAAVGLPEFIATRYPDSLSGGEKQRVAIARCLARNPLLIIADEPTASLDDSNKQLILALLCQIASNRGLGIVLITHERILAAQYCNRLFELIDGQLGPVRHDMEIDIA